jgi:hypothetical protein
MLCVVSGGGNAILMLGTLHTFLNFTVARASRFGRFTLGGAQILPEHVAGGMIAVTVSHFTGSSILTVPSILKTFL